MNDEDKKLALSFGRKKGCESPEGEVCTCKLVDTAWNMVKAAKGDQPVHSLEEFEFLMFTKPQEAVDIIREGKRRAEDMLRVVEPRPEVTADDLGLTGEIETAEVEHLFRGVPRGRN